MQSNTQYNLRQQQAIDASENYIVITAPPGSGKTTAIIGAIEKYAKENQGSRIVAVTFTKKAADDLANRINNNKPPITGCDIEVSTIHSWSYRQLQYFAGKYNFSVAIMQEEMIKDILVRICRKRNQYYLNQFMLYSYVMGNFNIDVDESLIRVFETIRQTYVDFKRRNKLYDFTDLPLYLNDVLEEYGETIQNVDALFVDEFQDVDNVQLEIFEKTFAKKKVYIGDRKQSIYIFRGASEYAFDNLTDFTDYYLDTNYRSYQEIIDYADAVNECAKHRIELRDEYSVDEVPGIIYESDIHCQKGTGGHVYVVPKVNGAIDVVANKELPDDYFSRMLRDLIAENGTQILCRANKQVKKIQSFDIQNVSTIHQAKGLEYDNVIVVSFNIDCDEEKNIAYVAMTRARNTLVIIDYQTLLYYINIRNIKHSNKLF